jgi:hypothetical protein
MSLVTRGMVDARGNKVEVLNGQYSIALNPLIGYQLLVSYEDAPNVWSTLEEVLNEPEGSAFLEDVRKAAIATQSFFFLEKNGFIKALNKVLK